MVNAPLPSQTDAYSDGVAWWLAHCSNLTYEPKAVIVRHLDKVGFDRVTFFDVQGSQAFLAEHPGNDSNPGFVVLPFRGTAHDLTDIFTDVNFLQRRIPDQDYQAHGGFLHALRAIWGTGINTEPGLAIRTNWVGPPGVSNSLNQILKFSPDKPIYFTGHSLGGALATLAAHKHITLLQPYQQNHDIAVYTFGSPRVASKALALAINKNLVGRIHRLVNERDLVA